VVTNWHVICDAAGAVTVAFPDGFRSQATVLAADRDWDLAALAIDRPPGVEPIPLAVVPPRPGDVLWIAGYGRGAYRASAGRCTQYVAPGRNLPFEMVELSTAARKGDSGGPILNARGELAGVLFGAGWGRTTGSYCGRVRWFLDSVDERFDRLRPEPQMIAQVQPPASTATEPRAPREPSEPREPVEPREPRSRWSADLPPLDQARVQGPAKPQAAGGVCEPAPLASLGREEPVPSRAEQIKTILAAIGLLAIVFHGLKLMLVAAK